MNEVPSVSIGPFVFGLVLFGLVWAWFAVPFAFHVVRAVMARDPWLPFDRKPDGEYTFLARTRWFSAFRAPEPARRTSAGLVIRYVIWVAVIVMLSVPSLRIIEMIREL